MIGLSTGSSVLMFCAYLRMPPGSDNGDAEVRTTILRVITAHLQSSAQGVSWSDLNFNFDRAELHNEHARCDVQWHERHFPRH